jgi:hypothetical protein
MVQHFDRYSSTVPSLVFKQLPVAIILQYSAGLKDKLVHIIAPNLVDLHYMTTSIFQCCMAFTAVVVGIGAAIASIQVTLSVVEGIEKDHLAAAFTAHPIIFVWAMLMVFATKSEDGGVCFAAWFRDMQNNRYEVIHHNDSERPAVVLCVNSGSVKGC